MRAYFALLLLAFGALMLGCIQSTPQENKETGIVIVLQKNVTGNASAPTQNETVSAEVNTTKEPPAEKPQAQPACEEGAYSLQCSDSSTVEEQKCVGGKIETKKETCTTDYFCYVGHCIPDPNKCVDSDGGNNITSVGKVSYQGKEYLDYCEMGDIIEYYCSKNGVQGARTECPLGTHCVNGSCSYWAPSCNKKANTVTMDNHTNHVAVKTDNCKNYDVLIRYSCLPTGFYEEKEITCASDEWCSSETLNCEKRRCDNGYGNIITKDSEKPDGVYYQDTFNVDYCMYNTTIKEVYCDGKKAKNATVECPTGYICKTALVNKTNTETNVSNPFYAAYCEFVNK